MLAGVLVEAPPLLHQTLQPLRQHCAVHLQSAARCRRFLVACAGGRSRARRARRRGGRAAAAPVSRGSPARRRAGGSLGGHLPAPSGLSPTHLKPTSNRLASGNPRSQGGCLRAGTGGNAARGGSDRRDGGAAESGRAGGRHRSCRAADQPAQSAKKMSADSLLLSRESWGKWSEQRWDSAGALWWRCVTPPGQAERLLLLLY